TPVYHVFQMYAAHQAGQAVRTVFAAPAVNYDRDGKAAAFWSLKGAASLKGKELTLTVVNSDVAEPKEVNINVLGGEMASGKITTLTHQDIHAHNTFENPENVRPQTRDLAGSRSSIRSRFAPASVNLLQIQLV